MDFWPSVGFNAALTFPNLLLNLFFLYCLMSPISSQKIKQPLKFLLLMMSFSSVAFLVCLISYATLYLLRNNVFIRACLLSLADMILQTSMTTSVWINIFYCSQIVPAKHAFFVWVKKNIKCIIFSAWASERLWISFHVFFLGHSYFPLVSNTTVQREITAHDNTMKFFTAYMLFGLSYLLLSLCAMIVSCVSVSSYLIRHVHSLLASTQSFSCPKFQGQLRVSLTALLQGFVYMCCALWMIYKCSYELVTNDYIYPSIHFSVINAYMLATTLNMWVGQAVFRQRTLDIILALRREESEDGGAETGRRGPPTLPTAQERSF